MTYFQSKLQMALTINLISIILFSNESSQYPQKQNGMRDEMIAQVGFNINSDSSPLQYIQNLEEQKGGRSDIALDPFFKYAAAVQTGLSLKYTSSAVCFQSAYSLLNDAFYLHQNITGYNNNAGTRITNGNRQYSMIAFNVSNIIAKNFANTYSNCYTTLSSAQSQTDVWLDQFVDFTDVYTSFLFNLLSKSLKIRSLSINIQTSQTNKDWVTFSKSLAQLTNVIFDFQSSYAESLDGISFDDVLRTLKFTNNKVDFHIDLENEAQVQSIKKLISYSAQFLGDVIPGFRKPFKEDQIGVEEVTLQEYQNSTRGKKLLSQKMRFDINMFRDTYETVKQGRNIVKVDQSFKFRDVSYIFFGIIEGATSAVPASLFNFQCGKNVTQSRLYFEASVLDFSQGKRDSGVANINKILKNADDITINCVLGFQATANTNIASIFTSDQILMNLLYNAGFMFTDVLDILKYDTSDTNPYWYYIFYRVGDFLIRFIYRDA
ncbi:UNKNOWN [Stylonychia lemnae]|uniref:Uncharacterized protein n=1 Tax=Stylonychia lemnae TaxID=5949 RepID=A0A078B1M5_STYLE|nr:UNKNOWN [Stylonychia lemnae]|eukprot:CDW87227.1 UNKNOWN [Stylonychia lemnae]